MNNFALVAYLPEPMRKFLDSLRRELVPGCSPHAHVTILPPRPLSGTIESAIEAIRARVLDFPPFEIKIGEVETFEASDVVYLSIGAGYQKLVQMHDALDIGPLNHAETYSYHPHITLAQDLTHEQSMALVDVARQRWADCPHSKGFAVESLVFVQNTTRNLWIDLARFQLAPAATVRG